MSFFKSNKPKEVVQKPEEHAGPDVWEFGQRVTEPAENRIIGSCKAKNSKVVFTGKGNILFLEDSVRMENTTLCFKGDYALIYLSSNTKYVYKLHIDAWRETTIFFGRDNYFNGALNAIVSERKNIVVGNEGILSFGIWMRTADPHLIYDCNSLERINPSKSILIGDHVWLGQNAMVLKGSAIGSGSIVSAAAVLAGKEVPSNTIYAGNPARKIKDHIFFSGDSVHNYTVEQSEESRVYSDDRYIYQLDGEKMDWHHLDGLLSDSSVDKCLEILQNLSQNMKKNRFYL